MIEMHVKEERRGGEGKTVGQFQARKPCRLWGRTTGDQAIRNDQEAKASSGHFFSQRNACKGCARFWGFELLPSPHLPRREAMSSAGLLSRACLNLLLPLPLTVLVSPLLIPLGDTPSWMLP